MIFAMIFLILAGNTCFVRNYFCMVVFLTLITPPLAYFVSGGLFLFFLTLRLLNSLRCRSLRFMM